MARSALALAAVAAALDGAAAAPAPAPAPAPVSTHAEAEDAGKPRDVATPPAANGSSASALTACTGGYATPMSQCYANVCCTGGTRCFQRDISYAQCRSSCTPGQFYDGSRTPWSCDDIDDISPPAEAGPADVCPSGALVSQSCSGCCADGSVCFEQGPHFAQCRHSCVPGVHTDFNPNGVPWTCTALSPPSQIPTSLGGTAPLCSAGRTVPRWGTCTSSKCCSGGDTCFARDALFAMCLPSCIPGVDNSPYGSAPGPWSCAILSFPLVRDDSASTMPTIAPPGQGTAPTQAPAAPAGGYDESCTGGPRLWQRCVDSRCCADGSTCFERGYYYAQCRDSCTPGIMPNDPYPGEWSCRVLTPSSGGRRLLGSTADAPIVV